jgi:hypothetical protein
MCVCNKRAKQWSLGLSENGASIPREMGRKVPNGEERDGIAQPQREFPGTMGCQKVQFLAGCNSREEEHRTGSVQPDAGLVRNSF